jgi:pimeloyl-ACP methyl ester carboxylesterase
MTGRRHLLAVLSAVAVAVAVGGLVRRYRRDIAAARARLATLDRKVVRTEFGSVAYTERGAGEPLLVSHGIYQSESDLATQDLAPDRRVIAPYRFGYRGSSLPPGATPAEQADALVELLDALEIHRIDVVGVSAGATSVLQLALRHPDRVKHLVLLSANLPGSATAVVQPSWTKVFDRQLPVWTMKTIAPRTMARLMGVPRRLPLTPDEAAFVKETIDSLFPITPNVPGVMFDAFVSNAHVDGYALEAITVPTLLVHARDDPLVGHEAAERAAERIPGARLISLESGGHLMLGQAHRLRAELGSFLADRDVA